MKLLTSFTIVVLICSVDCFSQKVGDAYALEVNNIYMPLTKSGVLADIDVSPGGSGGQFGGHIFLFSGGFFLSGLSNGQLWANAVASASRIEDYRAGTYQFGYTDPRAQLYKLRADDLPFGQSWQDWMDAVELGADYYDGNGDGFYIPTDLNANGVWDPNEDRPDLLGDEMLWCVFHDDLPSSLRKFTEIEPQGIEIRQSVFAYSNLPSLQNIIFIRYRILNTGLVVDKIDSVYFGVWDDADIGSENNAYFDDLVGCDTVLQGGYTYNDGPDPAYGNNPPCFFAKKN